jgi:hypothetical protein
VEEGFFLHLEIHDFRGQRSEDRKQTTEYRLRMADPPPSDKAGLWRGKDGEFGMIMHRAWG